MPNGFLILSRDIDEDVVIVAPDGTEIDVRNCGVSGGKVRLGFRGPRDYARYRREIWNACGLIGYEPVAAAETDDATFLGLMAQLFDDDAETETDESDAKFDRDCAERLRRIGGWKSAGSGVSTSPPEPKGGTLADAIRITEKIKRRIGSGEEYPVSSECDDLDDLTTTLSALAAQAPPPAEETLKKIIDVGHSDDCVLCACKDKLAYAALGMRPPPSPPAGAKR